MVFLRIFAANHFCSFSFQHEIVDSDEIPQRCNDNGQTENGADMTVTPLFHRTSLVFDMVVWIMETNRLLKSPLFTLRQAQGERREY